MREEHIPDELCALLASTESETIHVTFMWGNRKAFYHRFTPEARGDAITWALKYWRDGMRWAVAIDQGSSK